jgi:Protein of unknown function/AsmA-like C-terminal region
LKLPFANYVKAHHVSRAALCVGALAAAILFFAVGAAIRLLVGPVSLGPLRGTLAEAIQQALPGIALDYDQAAIEWSRDQGRVNLVVLGARMFDSHGRIVAQAPKADIDLAAAPFLKGRFEIRRITLVGVQLTLVRTRAGGLRLGVEQDPNDDIIARLTNAIDARSSASSSLESFAVRDARLAILDEGSGLYLVAPRAALMIRSRNNATGVDFDADVEISGRRAHLTAALNLPPHQQPMTGTLSVTGLDLRGLGANARMFAPLRDVALVTDLSTSFALAPGGHITKVEFDLGAHGEVPMAALRQKALHVSRLRLRGHYDGGPKRLTVDVAVLESREALARLSGAADFITAADGKLEKVRADLNLTKIALDDRGLFATRVGFDSLSLAGDYLAAPRRFEVTRFKLLAPSLALESTGTLTLADGKSSGLTLNARLAALPVRTLLHYWPLPVSPGAREWIDGNIFAGTIGPLTAMANFAPGMLDQAALPEESLKLGFAMQGIEGSYLKGLSHVTGVTGDALLTGDTFAANFNSGHVGNITVSNGRALIPNLHQHGTAGTFTVHADGVMPEIMTLIDMKPLNYPTRFGIDPLQTHGTASADLAFKVPMLKDVKVDAVGISVKAAVSDFGVLLGSHTRLANGMVNFEIDNSHLHQTGTVSLADARMAVDWTEDFNTTDPITTRLSVKGLLTEGARAVLNIGLTKILSGTPSIVADIRGHRGALRTADIAVELTPVTLTAPIVNLQKPAGAAAAARVQVNFGPGAVPTDETIRVTGPVLNATGTANFGKAGELTTLNFSSIKMGPLNDLSLILARSAAGDDYTLRGHSLDGSQLGHGGAGDTPTPGAAPADAEPDSHFHINAKLDRVALRNGVMISLLNLDMSGIGIRPATLAMTGSFSRSVPIAASIEMVPAGRKLTFTAGDAGLLAKGMFGFDSMRGGQLTINAVLPGRADAPAANPAGPDYQGVLTVRDFKMINQATLARLFSAGSLTGMSDLLGGEGISLEKMEMPFTSKNNVISIHDGTATGRAIGATADGYIDRPKGLVAVKGSLVPAYGLNSVLGNIPLLGDVLVSKKGEGIFGVTYSMTGNAEQPNISVNPLSVLTPGIFRRLFEGRMPNAANAPSNVQAGAQAQPTPRPAN